MVKTKEGIENILREHSSDLKDHFVSRLQLFGSFSVGKQSLSSDIDLIVVFSHPVDLFEFTAFRMILEAWFGRKVNLTTSNGLHSKIRAEVLQKSELIWMKNAA